MQLKIHQRKGDKNNTILYRRAVQFFADELLSKAKQNKLTLTLVFKKFKGESKHEFANAAQINRYNYKIEINKEKPFHAIISSIAHEMVHLRQGVLGKLIMTITGFKWNGVLYKESEIPENEYFDQPFEAEAYALEVELSKKFFRQVLVADLGEFAVA